MSRTALIIIFNHQYNGNIEILEQIYKDRFSDIYHLVPFYRGHKPNVIPVYDNSFFFQGYVAQGFKSFFSERYDHYFFIADDLVLNPVINERNYAEYLQLGKKTCFLPGLITLHERKDWWPRVVDAFRYRICYQGVEAEGQLPSYEEALKKFKRFGLQIKPLRFEQIWNMPPPDKDLLAQKYNLSYPLVGSYSDIFVISATNIRQFCHYCGVFAATRLFVEVGLPTAVVLSAENIVQESDLSLQGKALWTKEDYNILENYRRELKMLLDNFPANFLYLHPIKLSVWNTKSI